MTYAQNGEDDILARFFGEQRGGFFVEVGAHDGVQFSNTLLFEQRGWRGICVEPNPQTFPDCERNRPGSVCIQAACVADEAQTEATLYLSQMPVLATLTTAHEDKIATIHGNCGVSHLGFAPVVVPARTLDSILTEYPPAERLDLVSIDAEWTNADVLRGFSLCVWLPRMVVVEAGEDVEDLMRPYHRVFEHGSNLFYVREEADMERMRNAI